MSDTFRTCHELYRSQIQHEDNLLNQRVSWIVTSQAFLLGTYVFLINSPALHIEKVENAKQVKLPGSDGLAFRLNEFVDSVTLLRQIFEIVGFSSSVATFVSTIAAALAIGRLTKKYAESVLALHTSSTGKSEEGMRGQSEVATLIEGIHRREGLPPLVTKRVYRLMGLTASMFFAVAFAGAWLVLLFRAQSSVISLPLVVVIAVMVVIVVLFLLIKLSDWSSTGTTVTPGDGEASGRL